MSRTISGTSSIGVTLNSAADTPVTVEPATILTLSSGVALYGGNGAGILNWTVVNYGRLVGGTSPNIGSGIQFYPSALHTTIFF